jgi:hypothetical protein
MILWNLLAIGLFIAKFVFCWETCSPIDGGGFCPTGDKCCNIGIQGTSSCIPESEHAIRGRSNCCSNQTGCGYGYECKQDSNGRDICQLSLPPTDDPAPFILPRYKNCLLTNQSTILHGMSVSGSNQKLAYYSSLGSIDKKRDEFNTESHRNVTIAFITIHGSGRNAETYLCSGMAAVPDELKSKTIVIAPWFKAPDQIFTDSSSFLSWNETGPIPHTWRYGAEATDGVTSSFHVLDILVKLIMNNVNDFPNLEKVIVTGHSAGGQMTHRWALTSNEEFWDEKDNEKQRTVSLRVVVANPRSFCYLDRRRYNSKGHFVAPKKRSIRKCPGYNGWEWGLEPNGRVPLPRQVQRNIEIHNKSVDWMRRSYAKRNIVYLAGELDIVEVKSECEDDDFQGQNRFERSSRFFHSLQAYYGFPTHHRFIAEGVPHDNTLMYQSSSGQKSLFGDINQVIYHSSLSHREKIPIKVY